jgi:hypothetical protein
MELSGLTGEVAVVVDGAEGIRCNAINIDGGTVLR